MSRITTDIVKSLRKSLQASDRKTSAYDTQATIRRIENGVAWVHIPGGVDETPVQMTINASEGDTVQVRVSGGRAFLVGNATAPPTDDSYAKRLGTLLSNDISATKIVIKRVQRVVRIVKDIADNTNQYFWHTEEGDDTGAHITEKPQEEFLADPENGGGNLLARSNGIACRDGTEELAIFSIQGIRLGKLDEPHAMFTADASEFAGSNGSVVIQNNANGITTFTEGGLRFYQDDVQLTLSHVPVPGSFVVFSSGAAEHVNIMSPSTIDYSGAGKTITVHTGSSSGLHPATTSRIYVTYDTEEYPTTSVGIGSFDDGFGSGQNSMAIGENAKAYGTDSLAHGKGTIAKGETQAVLGKYNIEDRESLLIVGNGRSDSDRNNAFAVDKAGNGSFDGDARVKKTLYAKDISATVERISLSDLISVSSANATLIEGGGVRFGKTVQIYIKWKTINAITVPVGGNITNVLVGTILLDYLKPILLTAAHSNGDLAGGAAWYTIHPNGEIYLGAVWTNGAQRTIAAGTEFSIMATYIAQ